MPRDEGSPYSDLQGSWTPPEPVSQNWINQQNADRGRGADLPSGYSPPQPPAESPPPQPPPVVIYSPDVGYNYIPPAPVVTAPASIAATGEARVGAPSNPFQQVAKPIGDLITGIGNLALTSFGVLPPTGIGAVQVGPPSNLFASGSANIGASIGAGNISGGLSGSSVGPDYSAIDKIAEQGQQQRFINITGSGENGIKAINQAAQLFLAATGRYPTVADYAQMTDAQILNAFKLATAGGIAASTGGIASTLSNPSVNRGGGSPYTARPIYAPSGTVQGYNVQPVPAATTSATGVVAPTEPGILPFPAMQDTLQFNENDLGLLPEDLRSLVDMVMRQVGYIPTGVYGAYGNKEYRRNPQSPRLVLNDDVLKAVTTDPRALGYLRWFFSKKGMLNEAAQYPGLSVTAPAVANG